MCMWVCALEVAISLFCFTNHGMCTIVWKIINLQLAIRGFCGALIANKPSATLPWALGPPGVPVISTVQMLCYCISFGTFLITLFQLKKGTEKIWTRVPEMMLIMKSLRAPGALGRVSGGIFTISTTQNPRVASFAFFQLQ